MGEVLPFPPMPPRWFGHEENLRFLVRSLETGFWLTAVWHSVPGYALHAFNIDATQQDLGSHATKTGAIIEAHRMRNLHGGSVVDETTEHPGFGL